MSTMDRTESLPLTIRVQPHSDERELFVLGSVMKDDKKWHKIKGLRRDDFWRESHRIIFDILIKIKKSGGTIDEVTVFDELCAAEQGANLRLTFEEASRAAIKGLPHLLDENFEPLKFDAHVELLKNYGQLRRVLYELHHSSDRLYETGASEVPAVIAEEAARIGAVMRRDGAASGYQTLRDAADEWLAEYEALESNGRPAGMDCGLPALDELVGGWHEGQSVLIAGLSKMGKTKFTAQVVLELVARHGCAVEWYSVEMRSSMMAQRAISYVGGIFESRLRDPGKYNNINDEHHQARLIKAKAIIYELGDKIRFYNKPKPKLDEILTNTEARLSELDAEAVARGYAKRRPLIVVVDYIQRVDAGFGGQSAEYQNVTEASQQLTGAAIEKGFLGLYVSHFSRKGASRGPGELPKPSDMRGSGAIEQDCDKCLVVHRPYWDEPGNDDEAARLRAFTVAWLSLNRHGSPGTAHLEADLDANRFNAWEGEIPDYGIDGD